MDVDPSDALERRARLLHSVGRNLEALDLAEQALALDPTNESLMLFRAMMFRYLDRPYEALEAARQLAAIDLGSGAAHAEGAHALLRIPFGEAGALTAASTAVQLAPENSFAWLQLVRAHLALSRRNATHRRTTRDARAQHDAAAAAAAAMIQRHPSDPLTSVAVAVVALQKRPSSRWSIAAVVGLAYSIVGIPFLIFWALQSRYRRIQRLADAERRLRASLAEAPEEAVLLSLLGEVSHARGRVRSGIDSKVSAGRQNPDLVQPEGLTKRAVYGVLRVAAGTLFMWTGLLVALNIGVVSAVIPLLVASCVQVGATAVLGATAIWGGARYVDALPGSLQARAISTVRWCLLGVAALIAWIALGAHDDQDHRFPLVLWAGGTTIAWLVVAAGLLSFHLRHIPGSPTKPAPD